jgi:nitrate reductase NapAB chaperone NapD
MICSYLVIPEEGASGRVAERLAALPGCDVVEAENRDVLILVTDTPGLEEESDLRREVEALDGIQGLLLTFGEIDPDAPIGDPVATAKRADLGERVSLAEHNRPLPVLDSAERGENVS